MLRLHLARFLVRDERGSIAITFAICSVVLVLFTGAALDYARMSRSYTMLQNAADAALLSVAHSAKDSSDTDALKQQTYDTMAAMLPDGFDFQITNFTKSGSTLNMSAKGVVPASLTAVVGYNQFEPSATSEVYWGTGKVEVLLVLDNTGSMSSFGRMTALKEAAAALLDELEGSEEGLVKVGIVPFDVYVRVPSSYKTASWFTTLNWIVNIFWNGCITDRDQPYDIDDTPVTTSSTQYPGAICSGSSLTTIQPLTDDFTALNAKINAMSPAGYTNITIGLAWGLSLLSNQEPFTEGEPYGTENLTKYIVLITDGDNTSNRWTNNTSSIDARTQIACQSVKDAGVTLYTIRLQEGNETLLSQCASSTDTYFDVDDVNDLVPTFQAIGEQISQLRVAK
ncbi:MAG TPA: pilus assembly protein [Candidatus Krumholzibacteria bacterium]